MESRALDGAYLAAYCKGDIESAVAYLESAIDLMPGFAPLFKPMLDSLRAELAERARPKSSFERWLDRYRR